MADIASALRLPILLVVGMRLGCLNHALLTHAAILGSGLPFAGWVANQMDIAMERFDQNVDTLARRFSAPPLAIVAHTPVSATQQTVEQLQRALIKSD